MQRLRSWENYGKTFRKTSYTLAFSWSRKTIDKYHVFMTLTVSNSVGKHVENEAFAHTGKLQKNFQENRLFIGIFLVQGNMWWTSCFSWVLPRVNSKFAIRFQISENISMMSNFSVFHHFGKLTMNKGFCAVILNCKCYNEQLDIITDVLRLIRYSGQLDLTCKP